MNTKTTIPLSALRLNDGNPRVIKDHKFQKLVKSILTFPEMLSLREIVTDETTSVLGGNMRLRAMLHIAQMTEQELSQTLRQYGAERHTDYWLAWHDKPMADVKVAEGLTDEQKKEFIVKDNVGYGEWDVEELSDWGLDLPIDWENGIDSENADLTAEEDDFDENEVTESVVKAGEIWQLGRHRLMCGDSTSESDVARLMDGERADIAFTSPPYNAATTPTEVKMGKKTKYNGKNDDKSESEYTEFLASYLYNSIQNSKYSFMNIQSLSNNKKSLIDIMYRFRDDFADTIIWDKQRSQPAMANNVLNSEFEYIHIFGGNSSRAIGTIPFRGTISNILHIGAQSKNEFADTHNATFSVEFASFFINNFAKSSILDLFGGTGTTLIAAEQLDRTCYMMELDPHYCDVIIARWEKLTGQTATKIQ